MEALMWLAGCARSRAAMCRSLATNEIEMPSPLLSMRQEHKRHVARLFERMADQLERGEPLPDMVAALDLLVYAPVLTPQTGITALETLALRVLGEGAAAQFSVWLGSSLISTGADARLSAALR